MLGSNSLSIAQAITRMFAILRTYENSDAILMDQVPRHQLRPATDRILTMSRQEPTSVDIVVYKHHCIEADIEYKLNGFKRRSHFLYSSNMMSSVHDT